MEKQVMKKTKTKVDTQVLIRRLLLTVAYGVFYLVAFRYLEASDARITLIHTAVDEMIPFISAFIIPYYLWFGFVAVTLIWFMIKDKDGSEFRPLAFSLAVGCTIFLIISAVFPNGTDIRPHILTNGFFDQLVAGLYRTDTSTNIFPSIHVFNSLVCCAAVLKSRMLSNRRLLRVCTVILTISIILATMFLKQHSVIDVCGAFVMFGACYTIFYGNVFVPATQSQRTM